MVAPVAAYTLEASVAFKYFELFGASCGYIVFGLTACGVRCHNKKIFMVGGLGKRSVLTGCHGVGRSGICM